jgi:tRNA-uridine aminocarboxypropyltransferase
MPDHPSGIAPHRDGSDRAHIVVHAVPAYTGPMTQPIADAPQAPTTDQNAECPRCLKSQALCVCDGVTRIENKVSLLILQHPQEQDRDLGTARLTVLHFADAQLKIGLSWPSLTKILGRPVDPQRWAILYLGSVKAATVMPEREIVVVNRNGTAVDHQDEALRQIEGVILLDGTWSQAKALWWRNAWMLKCKRVVLGPRRPSRYGKLRREPRKDGLSTIEAAAMLLSRLEGKPEIEQSLQASFERLLARYRELRPAQARPRRDWRRRRR